MPLSPSSAEWFSAQPLIDYVNMELTCIPIKGIMVVEMRWCFLKIVGERIRSLRESIKLSQTKIAKEFGVSQSSLARYEIGEATPSLELLLKYADYFDVSMDYIFGRTDNPKGELYENHVNVGMNNPEMARFVEMCFDPGSAMNERLKATLVKMLSEVNEK